MHSAKPDTHTPDPDVTTNPNADVGADGPATLPWVTTLLIGHAVVLIITVWTLSTTTRYHWWFGITATLALLTRLVPDALELFDWACHGAQTWRPPVDPCPRIVVALAAITVRAPDYPEFKQWAEWIAVRLPLRTPQSRMATVIAALGLAVLVAGWAAWQLPSP
jgi:hypothetical protein